MTFSWWEEMHRDIEGAALIKDWLGSGGVPEPHPVAERRAVVCVACPCNQAKNWWDTVKNLIATTIKKTLEWKNKIGLKTTVDDALMMCSACGCCNRLAVWAPMRHIKEHTSQEVLEKFPSFCWKRIGIEETAK